MLEEIEDKLLDEHNQRIYQYKNSKNIPETFRANLDKSNNIKEEIYYLKRAQECIINEQDDCLSILGKVCKTWGILPFTHIFGKEQTCLWGMIAACHIYYYPKVQKLESKVESLKNTIEAMGKIIKAYHDLTPNQENQNLNEMNNFVSNEMVRRQQSNGELNI